MTVSDYMTGFLAEYDHAYTNATVLKWINAVEAKLDYVKTYLTQYYVRTLDAFQYTLPTGVTIEDVRTVYVNGKKYKKKDVRAYNEYYSFWYEDSKLCIYPACATTDTSYVSEAGEITFATDSITTTGDDFAFSVGDTILISGATTTANNRYATIIEADTDVLTFAASMFTAGLDAAAVTISRPKIKAIYEYKPTTKLIANITTDTLNVDDRWLEIYDYFIMSKIAYLAKDYADAANHTAYFAAKVKEYEDWQEEHRAQLPESNIVAEEEGCENYNSDFDLDI
jgi:hypothetical protein